MEGRASKPDRNHDVPASQCSETKTTSSYHSHACSSQAQALASLTPAACVQCGSTGPPCSCAPFIDIVASDIPVPKARNPLSPRLVPDESRQVGMRAADRLRLASTRHQSPQGQCELPVSDPSSMAMESAALPQASTVTPALRMPFVLKPGEDPDPRTVMLHVYDLTRWRVFEAFNQAALPMGAGGIYHIAVEVWRREWNYGFTPKGSGVTCVIPRRDPDHHYRGSIRLGKTGLTRQETESLVAKLRQEWRGDGYHWARKNCHHFAQHFAERLGVGSLPEWVISASRTAQGLAAPLDGAMATFESVRGALQSCAPDSQCCGKGIVLMNPNMSAHGSGDTDGATERRASQAPVGGA